MSSRKRPSRGARTSGYTVAIVINVILWYVTHNLLDWNLPVITERFVEVLPAVEWSLGATIIANALFMVYDPRWFRHLAQVGLNILALFSTYMFYQVFPFEFGTESLNWLVRVGLFLAMVGIVIGIVAELIAALFHRE